MILIIAEKPSLARNIVSAIGKMNKKGGYFEGAGYIVTWAFGHLFSLADIEYYSPTESGRWSMENIPCFPEKFHFKLKHDKGGSVDSGVKSQFETIKMLCNRSDVDTIVNAGDSDREGEIIVRICVDKTGVSGKAFKRLWLPDQTEETISEGLKTMKDETEYEFLASEGYARTYIDWLYGVNLTRYASLKTGTLLRVGRVIVPIVKAIYDRDMAIKNFVPEIYYAPLSKCETKGEEIELLSKKKFSKDELAEGADYCNKLNSEKAIVTAKKTKKDTLAPGKLYSLTKLQNVLGKKYKMSMDESLKVLQGLYEKGYVTYPRTNSEYLAKAEAGKIKNIISAFCNLGYDLVFKDKKTIFDDSKIESHSALTPTHKIPKKDQLSESEYKVYSTVMRRFAAVFCKDECKVEKTEITIAVGDIENFTLKGVIMKEPGWTKYDDYGKKDKTLPPLEKGDEVNTEFILTEKETSPPKHYTIETLNNYLKNPFKEDLAEAKEEDDAEEYRAIFEGLELGTEATRTGIIDNAKKSGYIALKKDVYTILPGGEFLIEALSGMNISMDKYKTSELGKALKKVYRGEIKISDSVEIAKAEIAEVFKKDSAPPEKSSDTGFFGDVAGICPVCGKDVIRNRFGYGCRGYKDGCTFRIGGTICGKTISIANIKKLLETGKTYKIEGFVSKKSGKSFDAYLKLDNEKKVVFDFND
ncbi:MAG: topoisomerase C-terminal repeat-containing protein [Clostridia bacterium]|nr:topoisomerase C-terminal repeat-containing protein [Clostridia bacterium]